MVDRSATHPLLGRRRELDALVGHLGVGGGTRCRAVLVAGDAGVGKTRLLAELTARAEGQGWRAVLGHCLDLADSRLPYLPFSELVGRLADEEPEAAARMVEAHPALGALAPGRRMLSGASRVAADELDRAELFDAVHTGLEELAEERPLLVLVEDVHWADQSTRDLLSFLFVRGFRTPVVVAASYRADDLHRRHPLRRAVAEWARIPGVQRLVLDPLPDADVRRLLRSLHPAPLRDRDVQLIVERAEGNAFFAEELLGAAELGEAALPVDLADLLLVRLDRLDEGARQVVRAASCAGRRVTHALLAAVVGLGGSELDRAVRGALDAQVLVQVGADGYAFRHALLAEAVYDDLLPGERVRLHAAYVEAMRSRSVDATAAELAKHARAAHDVETAVRASIRAGEDAMAVGGPEDAAKHFESALELLADPRRPEALADIDLVRLVAKTCDAVIASGQPGRALALVRDHLATLGPDAPPHDRARLLMVLATCALLNESGGDPLAATTEALGLIDEEATALRARLLGVHARANVDAGRDEDATRAAMEALALGQKLDLPRLVADATTTLAGLDDRAGDADQARVVLEQVVLEARRTRDTASEMRGQFLLGQLHHERAELPDAQAAFRLAAAAAAAAGRPWAPYGFDGRLMEALVAYQRGRWDEALAIADFTGQAPPADPEALLRSVWMCVHAGRGQREGLELYPMVRASWEREGLAAVTSGAAAIDLHGDAGEIDRMWQVHDDLVETLSRTWNPVFQARVRISALVLGQLADAAATAPQAERAALVARAPDLLAAVEAVQQRVRARKRPFGPEGRAWVARARAEELRLRWLAGPDPVDDGALVAAWEDALTAFEVMGHVFEVARTRARLGVVLRAAGRTGDARSHLEAARATAESLGAGPLLARLHALSGSPRAAGGARREVELTAREREILALVALGRSNAEIGRQLYISAKTVSVHVSNILAKLGASGRTEAAAIARRQRLLD